MPVSKLLIMRFEYAVEELNSIMDELRKDYPKANYYLDDDNLNLMKGPSHEGHSAKPKKERVICGLHLKHSGGGGW
jgi:hypothetical protein